ncbi:hypothetical protein LJR084_001934 [Variovorax sp. LjRoot84]|uniref:glycine-rich domain-containing protein n=1 Tax=Variovorax sp. LjRoot84 TaxID=3342340 RepID=UPI003ECCC2A2
MDRNINYPGQVPLEQDLLKTNQFTMIGLSKLAAAILGVASCVNGFATSQTVVPSMAVLVQPGEIYSLQNLEATAYSSLPADTTHSIMKQGVALDTQTIAVTAPGTAGFSINYLIQASYQETDTGSTVLPYYNASNPSVAYSGPANSGTAQPTTRHGGVVISAKAGTAATTGTQTTPAPDAGFVGLFVVTVANGASTVVNANISQYALAPFIPSFYTRGIARFTSNGTWICPWYVTTAYLTGVAGGGGGGAGAGGAGGVVGAGGGGGGAGQAAIRTPVTVVPGTAYAIAVGAAGAAGVAPGTGVSGGSGGNGGNTTFGALLTLTAGGGGSGGTNGSGPTPAGQGGTGFPRGSYGNDSNNNNASAGGGPGASSPFGGGGGLGRGGNGGGIAGFDAAGFGAGGGGGGGQYQFPGSGVGGNGGAGSAGFGLIEW